MLFSNTKLLIFVAQSDAPQGGCYMLGKELQNKRPRMLHRLNKWKIKEEVLCSQRAAEIRNRPPSRTQLRNQMITYLKHMGKYNHNQLKSKSFEEIQKLYKKEHQWINDFVPMSDDSGKKDDSSSKQAESSKKRPKAEHDEESVKKQKLQDDFENKELRACLDIVQGDDIAIDVESLATKYLIVD
ncbi:hypothetical protein Tco_0630664 [Tanacetum coccineum]